MTASRREIYGNYSVNIVECVSICYGELKMPWITNISMADVIKGNHPAVNNNTILIQIKDYDNFTKFPDPKFNNDFMGIYRYAFNDIDIPDITSFNAKYATGIAHILSTALQNDVNVIVHCHAGICRSGAVADVGIMMGFDDASSGNRIPNTLVKTLLRNALDIKYSWE